MFITLTLKKYLQSVYFFLWVFIKKQQHVQKKELKIPLE